jgi:hypothetical protein
LAVLKRTYPEDDGSTIALPAEMLEIDEEYAEVDRQLKTVREILRPLEKRRGELQAKVFDLLRTAKKGVLPLVEYSTTTVHVKPQAAYQYRRLNRKEIK